MRRNARPSDTLGAAPASNPGPAKQAPPPGRLSSAEMLVPTTGVGRYGDHPRSARSPAGWIGATTIRLNLLHDGYLRRCHRGVFRPVSSRIANR